MQFGDGKVFFPLNQGFIILLSFHMSSLSAELLGFSFTLLASFLKRFFFSLHSSSNHVFLGNVFLFLRFFLVLACSASWSRHCVNIQLPGRQIAQFGGMLSCYKNLGLRIFQLIYLLVCVVLVLVTLTLVPSVNILHLGAYPSSLTHLAANSLKAYSFC